MDRKTQPSWATWFAAASTVAKETGIPVEVIISGSLTKPACAARWKAWRYVLDKNPKYSIAGLGRVSGWHHSAILWAMKRLDGLPAKVKVRTGGRAAKARAIKTATNQESKPVDNSRHLFSEHVMRENATIGMTAEQFAQAVGQPLQDVLRRARAAGIEMRREGFAIARDVVKATGNDPSEPCVMLQLRSLS